MLNIDMKGRLAAAAMAFSALALFSFYNTNTRIIMISPLNTDVSIGQGRIVNFGWGLNTGVGLFKYYSLGEWAFHLITPSIQAPSYPAFADYVIVFYDLVAAEVMLLLFFSVREVVSTIRALEVVTAWIFALPVLVYVGDRNEFYIHATYFQQVTGFIPQFSNADLMVVSGVVLVLLLGLDLKHRKA